MNLPDALTAVVDIAKEAVGARSWYYGSPRTTPGAYPSVWVRYESTTPIAHASSTRTADGKQKRNSVKRTHRGTLYVLIGDTASEDTDYKVGIAVQQIMDAFDADETLRGTGSVDRTQAFRLMEPSKLEIPLIENGPLVLGFTSAFEIFESK